MPITLKGIGKILFVSVLRIFLICKFLNFMAAFTKKNKLSRVCIRFSVWERFHFWDWNVLDLFLFPRLNLEMPQRRMSLSTIKTHYFISFIFFLSSSAHRQPLGGVLQKIGSATVLKPIKKYLQRSSIFH